MKDKLLRLWDRIPPFMKNKFVLTGLAFFTYLLFFDSVDIPTQFKLHRHLRQLNHQTEYYRELIEKDKLEYASTFSSIDQMEKYAREEYKMKRPEEDLFIIEFK
jgi:hypothetical protein